jgi:DNA-binding GntR family transcriptional regulator
MTHDLKLLEHENLSSTVYATLCDAIIKGHFRPGDRLKIRDIAEQLGTSVTPVRDAILRLVHDEALVFQSARDIRIPIVSLPRYLEIRAIRLKLEAMAAEGAARLATKSDIATLDGILEENEETIRTGDCRRGTELNQTFHFQLSVVAQMPVLQGTLRRIWLQMGPLIAGVYAEGGRSMIDHHYPVLAAIRRRDPAAAADAIMHDILYGGQAILDRVQENT